MNSNSASKTFAKENNLARIVSVPSHSWVIRLSETSFTPITKGFSKLKAFIYCSKDIAPVALYGPVSSFVNSKERP